MRSVLRRSAFVLALAALLLSSTWAHAAPRDKAALKKIDEAIFTNFLNMDFDAAEGLLLGTIRACEDKCSPEVLGKAWMYVGIVRGSGRNDMSGAQEAFKTAVSTDPNVQLDAQVAGDPVKALFAKVKGGGGGGGGAAPSNETTTETAPAPKGATFTCAPSPTEIETRRPVPLQCETDADLASATLHYKTFEGGWASVKMAQEAGAWRGTIPCSATQNTGKLRYYVEGADTDGKVVAKLGDKGKPNTADIVSETSADPPAFPEEEPPARCSVGEGGDEPSKPSGGGGGGECGAWGAPCGADNCCQEGLSCNAGTCESPCQSDSDCKDGATCTDGKCEGGGEGASGGGDDKSKSGKPELNWIGLHFGLDFASISHDKACDPASLSGHIACFYSGSSMYTGTPSAVAPGRVTGGLAPATMRVMASYERLFGPLGLEGRLGFAFNGGPTPTGGSPFLPVHAELRVKYWLRGTGGFEKKGLRPWIHLGGGLAEFDAQVGTDIVDCPLPQNPTPNDQTRQAACKIATDQTTAKNNGGKIYKVIASKQLGLNFVTAGGGLMYAVGKNHGAVLNVDVIIPFASTGIVLEPTLGYQFGF